METTIPFTVHTTTFYGLDNGFSEFDDNLLGLLREEVGEYTQNERYVPYGFRSIENYVIQKLNKDPTVYELAMDYYHPYPINESWTPEYKQYVQMQITLRRAAGVCDIPIIVLRPKVLGKIKLAIQEFCQQKLEGSRRLIAKAEQQACGIPSPEHAQQLMRQFNALHNEGGYGFVPGIIDSRQHSAAKQDLSFCESLESKITSAEARAGTIPSDGKAKPSIESKRSNETGR